MLATPEASVRAVAETGEMAASVASVLKVTTVLATGAPVLSRTVALTVAVAPVEIEFVVLPDASVMAKVMVGVAAVVPSLPVVPPVEPVPGRPVELAVPPAPPDPQPASMANAVARKSDADNRAIFEPSELWLT